MLYFGNIAYYLHGASSNKYRNMMAPYMLQWEAVKDAKKRGYKLYDFWGISPLKGEITNNKSQISNKSKIRNPNNQNKMRDSKFQISNNKHPWYGISRFKLGFAPTAKTGLYVEYPGCYEVSYGKKRYMLYSMFKKAF
jgi:lipid II:glycine glycyltransferase (peptidoglycan interpeptide bridge formation enzyme)